MKFHIEYAYNHYYLWIKFCSVRFRTKKHKILTSQKYPLYGSICIMYIVEQRLLVVVMWYIHFMWLSLLYSQGFLFACEVRRFCGLLRSGNVRSVEVFCSTPQSTVLESPEWAELKTLLDPASILYQKNFIERCEGQAVFAVGKTRPSTSKMGVKDDATLVKFCDSFR